MEVRNIVVGSSFPYFGSSIAFGAFACGNVSIKASFGWIGGILLLKTIPFINSFLILVRLKSSPPYSNFSSPLLFL